MAILLYRCFQKKDDQPAYAVVDHLGNTLITKQLTNIGSIFTAETAGIIQAINIAATSKKKTIIFSDSLSVLRAAPADGRLIDIVDNRWREEELPFDQILVPADKLPDPEADGGDSHLTLSEQRCVFIMGLVTEHFKVLTHLNRIEAAGGDECISCWEDREYMKVCNYCSKIVLSYLRSPNITKDLNSDLQALQQDLSSKLETRTEEQPENLVKEPARCSTLERKISVGYQEERFASHQPPISLTIDDRKNILQQSNSLITLHEEMRKVLPAQNCGTDLIGVLNVNQVFQ
ncbi:Putative 1-phosphatidylinositol 3-phosphate 5-kinase [Eumeta japonica]|uniref:Anaphase-promoting complex subunit 13 n=1 Tax=Eumeta variegata TaxID=151549 RepID=A0A4C1T6W7_EUMVA|nr:Putative 1-phosphatidylinositol 3-phosphate 5-kinase [Eumeta japonica]